MVVASHAKKTVATMKIGLIQDLGKKADATMRPTSIAREITKIERCKWACWRPHRAIRCELGGKSTPTVQSISSFAPSVPSQASYYHLVAAHTFALTRRIAVPEPN